MDKGRKNKGNEITTSKVLEVASTFAVPSPSSKEEIWVKMNLKQSKQIYMSYKSMLKIAASILLIAVSLTATWQLSTVRIITKNGEHKSVLLPDNSKIRLNAASQLSYNSITWKINRKVNFQGEGIFRVTKGSTFSVLTPTGSVEVLGTSFNVKAREASLDVSCISGKVRVFDNKSSVILTKGLKTNNVTQTLSKPQPFNSNTLAWESGEFYFDNSSFVDVIKVLERQFDIDIILHANKKRYYTGFFTNKDMDEALKLVCIPLGLQYQTLGDGKISITSKGLNV